LKVALNTINQTIYHDIDRIRTSTMAVNTLYVKPERTTNQPTADDIVMVFWKGY